MRIIHLLIAIGTPVFATNLFVSSYAGTVSTLSLSESGGKYNLTKTATTEACGPNPSWLTIDANRGLLFCLNEGLTSPNGSLSSFTINDDGTLDHVQNTTTISGPVSGAIYGSRNKRAIALAHYAGSAVTTYCLDDAKFQSNQNFTFSLASAGVDPGRQNAPHLHDTIIDPTNNYLVVPDLGADLVRVFAINGETLEIRSPLSTDSGTGPRHAAFYNPYSAACESCTTFMYVVGELSSDVTGYAVTYLPNRGGLNFTKVYQSNTLWLLNHDRINAPAEIHVSVSDLDLASSRTNHLAA